MISLGIIGEYVGKTYIEAKKRPLFFVREEINLDENDSHKLGRNEAEELIDNEKTKNR